MAFVAASSGSFAGRALSLNRAKCETKPPTPVMAYDMDGSSNGTLGPRRIKSSAVENDRRMFRVAYCLPSQSRGYTFRELQNVYTVKNVPFSSWYSEQQRIQKMGGTIFKVELLSGTPQRSVSAFYSYSS